MHLYSSLFISPSAETYSYAHKAVYNLASVSVTGELISNLVAIGHVFILLFDTIVFIITLIYTWKMACLQPMMLDKNKVTLLRLIINQGKYSILFFLRKVVVKWLQQVQ